MGYLYALISALLFGANGTVTKVIIEAGLSPTQVTQLRTLGSAVIAGIVLAIVDRGGFRMTRRQSIFMVLLGVVGVAILQASYAFALQALPVGIALLLEYLAVLFVAIIAFAFLKEQVKARLWVAIGLVLLGLVIVAEIWSSRLDPFGVVMAIVAALALTLYFLVGERQATALPPLAVAFWTNAFAAVFWLFFSGWWSIDPEVFLRPVSLQGSLEAVVLPLWVLIAWNIVMGSFLPFLFSFLALRRLTATATGVTATSEVLFAFVVAWLWLAEGLNTVQVLGAAIVLVGIVLAQTARVGKAVDADLALPANLPPG